MARAKGRYWAALGLVAFLVTQWLLYARQTAAIHAARELADLRARRANLDGHRADLERRIRAAESRAVLVPRAQARLGLHLPSDSEIVLVPAPSGRSEEHTSELQSRLHLVCRLLLEKKKTNVHPTSFHIDHTVHKP